MIRRFSGGLVVLVLLLAMTAPAMAQKRGGGGKNKAALSVSVTPESFSESDAGATGTVTRENSDTSVALTVTVTSSDGTEALVSSSDGTEPTVSASVEIPVGATSADFDVTAVDDTVKDGDQQVTISVSATDHQGASASITVVDDDGLPQIEYIPSTVSFPTGTMFAWTNQLNDSGIAVGWYDSGVGRFAWMYDPADTENPNSVIDLNDLAISGVDPGWVIASAVSANNNGLVVGYLETFPDRDQRRGFVLDLLTMELSVLPDSGYGWTRPAGAGVNDRGDILGIYVAEDGPFVTQGFYLVNLGLRGEENAFPIEIPEIETASTDQTDLNNPVDGTPAKVIAPLGQGGVVVYSQGGGVVTYPDPNLGSIAAINDSGDIAVETLVEEFSTKGNKSRVVSTSYDLFRVIDGEEEVIPLSFTGLGFSAQEINNDHTVLIVADDLYLYHDQYGLLPVALLTSLAELPVFGVTRMNNVGADGFSVDGFSEIAGVTTDPETSERFLTILTPVDLTP